MNPIQHILHLDLQYLVHRLVQKCGWRLDEAQETLRKYKNFLILKYLYPKLRLVPTREIDEVWHCHILFTRNYMNDCDRIFGYYLHHTPSPGTPEEQECLDDLYTKTLRLYEEHFQEPYGHDLDIARW